MKKKQLIWIGVATCASILIAIILSFVLNVLFKVHSDGIFSAEWKAGDALNYAASIFGAVGTIVLGYVAYKQNDKLQKMEDNNYIANYSSMIILNTISINQVNKVMTRINPDECPEQIIIDSDWKDKTPYLGYKFIFNAKSIENGIPALIHIKDCNIFCSDESNKNMISHLFGKNNSNEYSRIAIHQDENVKFEMTYVIDAKKRVEFESAIKQSEYSVVVEIVFDIVTDKSVVTACKCISHCDGKNFSNQITWEDKDPKVFFYGHNIVSINELKIAGEKENHGKIKNANRKYSRQKL